MNTATLPRKELNAALATLVKVAPKRTKNPILSTILIQECDGVVTLRATDAEVHVAVPVDGATASPGFSACIPAHRWRDIEKTAPGPDGMTVALAEGDRATLSTGPFSATVDTLNPVDFPALPVMSDIPELVFPCGGLRAAIESTRIAMSDEETRYFLCGIFVHPVDSASLTARFVAIDGHKLATRDCAFSGAASFPSVIVPRQAVGMLAPLLKGKRENENVFISVTPSHVSFRVGGVSLVTNTVHGSFPDYARVIPSEEKSKTHATFNRESAIAALKAVTALSPGKKDEIPARLSFGDSGLVISALSRDGATCIACDRDDAPLDVLFSASYLTEILGAMRSPNVSFSAEGALSPARVTGDNGEFYVLMPRRA